MPGWLLEKNNFNKSSGALETLCCTNSQVEIELAREDLAEFHSFHDHRFSCFKGKFFCTPEMMFSKLFFKDTYTYVFLNADNVCVSCKWFSEASTLPTIFCFQIRIGPNRPGEEATRNRPGETATIMDCVFLGATEYTDII